MPAASSIVVLLAFVAIGVLLRVMKVVGDGDTRALGQVVIKVTLPATCFLAIVARPYGLEHGFSLAVTGAVVPVALVPLAFLVGQRIDSRPQLLGVMVCGASVANLGFFLYPIVESLFGDDGIATLVYFDVGNTIVAYSVTLLLARKFGDSATGPRVSAARLMVRSMPLWALCLGLICGFLGIVVPDLGRAVLEAAKACNAPLTMIILGMALRPRLREVRLTVATLLVRHGAGSLLGVGAAYVGGQVFGWSTLDANLACLASGMPVGMIILIYSINEKLDEEFGASLVSVSLLVGFVQVAVWVMWWM